MKIFVICMCIVYFFCKNRSCIDFQYDFVKIVWIKINLMFFYGLLVFVPFLGWLKVKTLNLRTCVTDRISTEGLWYSPLSAGVFYLSGQLFSFSGRPSCTVHLARAKQLHTEFIDSFKNISSLQSFGSFRTRFWNSRRFLAILLNSSQSTIWRFNIFIIRVISVIQYRYLLSFAIRYSSKYIKRFKLLNLHYLNFRHHLIFRSTYSTELKHDCIIEKLN